MIKDERNKQILQDYKKILEDSGIEENKKLKQTSIKTTNTINKLKNIKNYSDNTQLIMPKNKNLDLPKFNLPEGSKKSLHTIMQDIVDPLIKSSTKKISTTDNIVETSLKANSLLGRATHNYSTQNINPHKIKTVQEILGNAGRLVYFDTETLGGTDSTGQRDILSITDLSYIEGIIKDGKLTEEKVHNYYWGITSKDRNLLKSNNYYKRIVDDFVSGKPIKTNQDQITLERLALFGNKHTKILDGKIEQFATMDDLRGTISKQDVAAGYDVIMDQLQKQFDGEVDGILPWERDALNIIENLVMDPQTVISGNNINKFDIPAVIQVMQENLGDNAKKELNSIMKGQSVNELLDGRTLDALPLLREGFRGEVTKLYTHEQLSRMSAQGTSPFQLESLKMLLPQSMLESDQSHTSEFDVKVGMGLLTTPISELQTTNVFKKEYGKHGNLLNALLNIGTQNIDQSVPMQQGQVYLFDQTLNADNYRWSNVLAFGTNNLEQIIKAPDKYVLTPDGRIDDRIISNTIIPANSTFELNDYGYIDIDDEMRKTLSPYKFLKNEDRLYYASLKSNMDPRALGVEEGTPEYKLFQEHSIILGTEESVSSIMNSARLISEDGESFTENGRKIAKTITPDGKSLDIPDDITVQDYGNRLWEARYSDRARRAMSRTDNFKQVQNMINVLKDQEEYAARVPEDQREDARKAFLQNMMHSVEDLATKQATGQNLDFAGQAGIRNVFDDYFRHDVAQETIRNLYLNEDYFRTNYDFLNSVVSQVKDATNDEDQQKMLYQYIMKNISDGVRISGSVDRDSIEAVQDNFFEFNLKNLGMNDFAHLEDDEAILRMRIDKDDYGFFNKIARKAGRTFKTPAEEKAFINKVIPRLLRSEDIAGEKSQKLKDMSYNGTNLSSQIGLLRNIISDKKATNPSSAFKKDWSTLDRQLDIAQILKDEDMDPEKLVSQLIKNAPDFYPANYDNIESLAKRINENIFHIATDKDNNIANQLQKMGLDKETAENVLRGEIVRKQETFDIYKNILDSAASHGINLQYNKETNMLSVLSPDGTATELSQLPQRVIRDGTIATKVGNMHLASPMMLGVERGKVKLQSTISEAQKQAGNINTYIKTALENRSTGESKEEAMARGVEQYSKKLGEYMREAGSIMYFTPKESKSIEQFDVGNIVEIIKQFPDADYNFDETLLGDEVSDKFLNKSYRELLESTIKEIQQNDKIESISDLKDYQSNILSMNIGLVFKGLSNYVASEDDDLYNFVANTIAPDNYGNQAKDFIFGFGDFSTSTQLIEKTARGIDYQSQHATPITPGRMALVKASEEMQDIGFGRGIETPYESSVTNRKIAALSGASTADTVRVKALFMNDKQFHDTLAQHIDKTGGNRLAVQRLENLSLLEGAGIVDPRMVDMVYPERVSVQKINETSLASEEDMLRYTVDIKKAEQMVSDEFDRREKLAPIITTDEDGFVIFKYGDSEYVQRGDKLITTKQIDNIYEETARADRGFLKYGLYDRGTGGAGALTEEEITDYLNQNIEELSSYAEKYGSGEIDSDITLDYLLNQRDGGTNTFIGRYYVDELENISISKYIEGLEKNMAIAPRLGLGQYDDRIGTLLSNLELEDYKGAVLDIDIINEFGEDFEFTGSSLSKIYEKETGKALSKVDFNKALTGAGFESPEELREAMLSERYAAWDIMTEAMEEAGVDMSGVRYLTDNLEERMKHGNIEPFLDSAFLTMREQGIEGDKIAEMFQGIIYDKDDPTKHLMSYNEERDQLLLNATKSNNVVIDKNELLTLTESLSENYDFTAEGGEPYIKMATTLSRVLDPDRAKQTQMSMVGNQGMKKHLDPHFTDWFGMRNLMLARYDEGYIQKMADTVGEEMAIEQFGDVMTIEDGKVSMKEQYKNQIILSNLKKSFDQNVLYDPMEGDSLLVDDFKILNNQFVNSLTGHERESLSKMQSHLPFERVSQNRFGEYMSRFYALEAMDYNDMAVKHNKEVIDGTGLSLTKERLVGMGFQEVGIDDIAISKSTGDQSIPNINLENNLIINLNSKYLGDGDLVVDSLALPKYSQKFVGDYEITTKPQSKMFEILSGIQKYDELIDAEGEGSRSGNIQERIERQKSSINDKIEEYQQLMLELNQGKRGQFAQFDRHNMSYGQTSKAILSNIYDSKADSGYAENLIFEGYKVKDLYLEHEMPVSFVTVSDRFFDDQYYEGLEAFGISGEDVKEKLKTEGTIGFSKRNPEVYLTSYAPTMIAIDETLSKEEMRGSFAAFLAKKADSDGDYIEASLHDTRVRVQLLNEEGRESVSEKILDIDYGRYNILKERYESPDLPALTMDIDGTKHEVKNIELVDPEAFTTMKQKMWADADAYNMYHDAGITSESPNKLSVEVLSDVLSIHGEEDLTRSEIHDDVATGVRELSKLNKRHAGIINMALTDVRTYAVLDEELSHMESLGLSQVLTSMEEDYLSPKHSAEDVLASLSKLVEVRGVMSSALAPGDRKDTSQLENYIRKNIWDSKEWNVITENDEEQKENLLSGIIGAFNRIQETPEVRDALGTGKRATMNPNFHKGLTVMSEKMMNITQSFGMLDKVLDPELDIAEASYYKQRALSNMSEPIEKAADAAASQMSDAWKTETARRGLTSAAREASQTFSSNALGVSINTLAVAGIAGAFMMAGFVGGNPSKPTQQQAEEQHRQQQAQQQPYYDPQSLQDANLTMAQNPQQGYVININAESNRNKKELQKTISNSFSASYPTNLNIQMNMRDNVGNINDREIEKIIARAIY